MSHPYISSRQSSLHPCRIFLLLELMRRNHLCANLLLCCLLGHQITGVFPPKRPIASSLIMVVALF